MRYFYCLLLIGFSISINAQNAELLPGNWELHKLAENKNLSAKDNEMMSQFFAGSKFRFTKDGDFVIELMGIKSTGSYIIDESGNAIEMTLSNGKKDKMDIVELTNENLTVALSQGKGKMIMKRAGGSAVSEATYSYEKATKSEISKKWYLQNRTSAVDGKIRRSIPKSEQTDQYKALKEIMHTITFEITEKGVFKTGGPEGVQKGKWKFGKKTDTIIVTNSGSKTTWKIHKISKDELILNQANTDDFYFFGLKPIK